MTDGTTDAYVNSSQREGIQRRLNAPEYVHTLEGADDMPAHAKSTLSGVSLIVPITNGRLISALGRASTSMSTEMMPL